MNLLKSALFTLMLLVSPAADRPAEIPLWPNGAPGSEGKASKEIVRTDIPRKGKQLVGNSSGQGLDFGLELKAEIGEPSRYRQLLMLARAGQQHRWRS